MAKLPIPIPPKDTREAIAAGLGALDDKIELNRRMKATLEAMARARFQTWFVAFDPVRAKLDGRQPPGLDKATAALFPATFQDSPIGPAPKGWKVERFDAHKGESGRQLWQDCAMTRRRLNRNSALRCSGRIVLKMDGPTLN